MTNGRLCHPDEREADAACDEDGFASFEQFGAYIRYRVGIADNGDWLFFVAGD